MGEILAVQIFSCDDSTYWQTGKLLFSGQCVANGNCILIVKFSACGGINGHFAFNGDSGRGLFLSTQNAAAADGRAAGKPIIRSCAALCGDVGGTGFGALDGDFISSFISGSVIVRFGFCAAADAGCTNAARCVLDLCVACDGHSAKAAHAAADTGTFLAALCMIDYCVAIRCVAINDHSAFATNEIRSVKRNSAAADACAIGAALCALDLCVACDGHIAIAARTAADAGATVAALGLGDRCIAINGHIAKAARAAADASTIVAAGRALDGGASFDNKHLRAAIDTAADACAAIAALCFFDRCVILDGYSAGKPPTTAANTGRLFAASNSFNRCIAGNCHIVFTGVTAADAGTSAAAGRFFNNSAASNGHSCITARTTAADACAADRILLPRRVCSANGIDRSAKGIDRSAGNGNVGITARTATADTSAIGAARRGNAATGDLNFTCVIEISAANARAAIIAGSTQGTIAVGIGDRQFSAGFISLGISLFVVFQTGMLVAAGQCVVTVQFDVGIAAAGHFHSGPVCRAGVDLHIFQGDIGRLALVCIDGDRVPRACARARVRVIDGDVVVCVLIRSVETSTAVAVIFRTILIEPLGDEIAAFFSVNFNGAVGDIIRTGKSRKGHAGHHGTGESEGCDPLCRNAGRGRCLFLAEKHRNMPQDAHGESAIRDH